MKSGQISLVLIIIVVLGLLLVFSYLLSSRMPEPTGEGIQTVESYVTDVLKQTSEYCLVVIGIHGGRLKPTEFAELPFGNVQAAYQNRPVFLTQSELADKLENCIEDRLLMCADGFSVLEEFGSDVTVGNPTVSVLLAASETRINLDMPVTIASGENQRSYQTFSADMPVRLRRLHSVIEQATVERSSYLEPGDFDLTTLGRQDVNTSIVRYGSEQVMVLKDHHSIVDQRRYIFLTASTFGE